LQTKAETHFLTMEKIRSIWVNQYNFQNYLYSDSI
jgi:hypothetical protein